VATGRFFLSELPKDSVTVAHIANHIDYVRNLVGIEHVGLGTDFDGGGGVVGMENASKMMNLTIELLRRGYTEEELEKFWGANFLGFLKVHNL
jgi:membrane dipeptidase